MENIEIDGTTLGWQVALRVDGEAVSGLNIVDRKVRVGSVGLKTGGMAGVWTSEAHRKKGYASRVMWASIEEMDRRGYHASILYGIEDFYHRHSYSVCFASPICQVAAESFPVPVPGFRVRTAKKGYTPRISGLYQRYNEGRSASAIRAMRWMPNCR